MAREAGTTNVDAPAKKERKKPVRRPVELAVVARVVDEAGNPIAGATVQVIAATKDISSAFKMHKQTPGSDMVTFKLGENKEASVEKAA